jgi:hypothetical protein
MNDSAFKSGWAALLNGFPNSSQSYTKESMKVYWSSLRNIPDDLWQRGVQKLSSTHRVSNLVRKFTEGVTVESPNRAKIKADITGAEAR